MAGAPNRRGPPVNTLIEFADERMGEMLIAAGAILLVAAFSIAYLF
jgi:hypothetical protein